MTLRTAWICFPTAPYTHNSASRAADRVLGSAGWKIRSERGDSGQIGDDTVPKDLDLYLADYDLLPFEEAHKNLTSDADRDAAPFPQLSSYMIRKSLIRKNHLAHSIHLAKVKTEQSGMGVKRVKLEGAQDVQDIAPMTIAIELASADELDELLADDLYEVRQTLETNETLEPCDRQWFILKPAMADQGMGIRLFDTVDRLNAVFEEFEDLSDDEEDQESASVLHPHPSTAVVTSQVRQFVVQKYLSAPLLVHAPTLQAPHKFHIRAYALAQGSLRVFLYDEMLALFAPEPYQKPGHGLNGDEVDEVIDMFRHLTNTSRQDDDQSQRTVHLLSDLIGSPFRSVNGCESLNLTTEHLNAIKTKAAAIIARTFLAAVQAGRIHFQPWPNAWEIFGIDLVITVEDLKSMQDLRVWLLEVNAQPDFAKSGARLQEKIDRLFERSLQICTLGQDGGANGGEDSDANWQAGQSRDGMTLCLDVETSAGGW